MKKLRLIGFLTVLGAASLYLGGCDGPTKPDDGGKTGPGDWNPVLACPGDISAGVLDLNSDNLGLESDYAVIKFNNGSAPTVTFNGPSVEPTIDGEHVSLKVHYYYTNNSDLIYNVIVMGTAKNGSLRIEGGYRKTLYLNGADITNPTGPAINIQSGKRVDVHLVGSCDRRNILKGAGRETVGEGEDKEQFKGAFFSEGSLIFGGSGSLEVSSTKKHAIVSDGFIEVESGNILIYQSESDGIHANERIAIKGGKLQIKCEGDAIQNERKTAGQDKNPCKITVSGGDIKIRTTGTKGHGIVSDSSDVVITGDATKIDITLTGNGSKGIRSRGDVEIDGATTYLEAHGARVLLEGEDTSSAAGIRADGDVKITRGVLTIKSTRANENGKGLNIDGALKVIGGTTSITADGDGVKVLGAFNMSGGTLKARSARKKDIDCNVDTYSKTGGTLDAGINSRK